VSSSGSIAKSVGHCSLTCKQSTTICKSYNFLASSVATDVTLVNPQSISFGNQGELYVVESDTHHINRVRVVTSDGLIHHFAGVLT
jgi:hypothetical protein